MGNPFGTSYIRKSMRIPCTSEPLLTPRVVKLIGQDNQQKAYLKQHLHLNHIRIQGGIS